MFKFNKRSCAIALTAVLVLSGCGAAGPDEPKPHNGSTDAPGAVSGPAAEAVSGEAVRLSPDRALEIAQNITLRLSLDEKVAMMVKGYDDIDHMLKYFPDVDEEDGDEDTDSDTTDTPGDASGDIPGDGTGISTDVIPEDTDSLMTIRDKISERYTEPIGAGADRIMMSVTAYPKISAMITSAFLSYEVVTSLLRTELGFDGVIYTPPLNDNRLIKRYPDDTDGYLAVEAVKAGCDIIYQPRDKQRAIQALRVAVNTSNMSMDRIDASVVRIIKQRLMSGRDVELLKDRKTNSDKN
ncbi:MAG TPA: hypothetical protein DCP06_04850 [Lachnospiraceae bacterium]|nr:hypothetical protein [Lachnospiraceae bacterium]